MIGSLWLFVESVEFCLFGLTFRDYYAMYLQWLLWLMDFVLKL